VHKCRSGASAKGGAHIAADSFILLSLCRHWGGRGEDSQASGSFFEKKRTKKTFVLGLSPLHQHRPSGIKSFLRAFFQKSATYLPSK
jgi:hypothetical protein